jgi:hypothetical protein
MVQVTLQRGIERLATKPATKNHRRHEAAFGLTATLSFRVMSGIKLI